MSVELRHLRALVAAAEAGSFTAAARSLHLTQQSLSRTIAQLESRTGAQLFERRGRSVTLTAAGEAMLPGGRRALAAADAAVDAAREGTGQAPLRVDVSSAGIETGALILRALRRDHRELAVEQTEVGVARGLGDLLAGRLDVVLGGVEDVPPGVATEPVRREPVLVAMAADHALAATDAVPVAALGDVELLLPADAAAGEWNVFVGAFCRTAGVPVRRFRAVTHGSVAAAEVLREGGCVCPTLAWAERLPGLVFRPLVDPAPVFEWSLMTRADGDPPPGVTRFRDVARALAERRGWLA